MKGFSAWAMAATVLMAGVSLSGATAAPSGPAAESAWREDLQALTQGLAKRHAAPFNFTPKARFDAMVAALSAKIGSLNRDQIFVEFDRIAGAVGDAHTYVVVPNGSPRYPLSITRFGDEFRVTHAGGGHERALGARVLKIDDAPVGEAFQRIQGVLAANENPPLREAWATGFLNLATMLHGLDLTSAPTTARYTLAGDDDRTFVEEVSAVAPATVRWASAAKTLPLSQRRPTESFWCQSVPEVKTVYCRFLRYDDLRRKSAEMLAMIKREDPEKLVIDMREGPGGDYKAGYRHVIAPIRKLPKINRNGHLFVLIGPVTFSAALANAVQFRTDTNAILVGTPIGEKPNSYSENDEFKLPNSGWVVSYSTRYYEFVKGGENIVRPDKQIAPTWEAFKAGRDPALDYALAYVPG